MVEMSEVVELSGKRGRRSRGEQPRGATSGWGGSFDWGPPLWRMQLELRVEREEGGEEREERERRDSLYGCRCVSDDAGELCCGRAWKAATMKEMRWCCDVLSAGAIAILRSSQRER